MFQERSKTGALAAAIAAGALLCAAPAVADTTVITIPQSNALTPNGCCSASYDGTLALSIGSFNDAVSITMLGFGETITSSTVSNGAPQLVGETPVFGTVDGHPGIIGYVSNYLVTDYDFSTADTPPLTFSIGGQSATANAPSHSLTETTSVDSTGDSITTINQYTGTDGTYGDMDATIDLDAAAVRSLFLTGAFNYSVISNGPDPSAEIEGFEVTITPEPEPGTWALMVIGTAGIGVALRRRVSPHRRPTA